MRTFKGVVSVRDDVLHVVAVIDGLQSTLARCHVYVRRDSLPMERSTNSTSTCKECWTREVVK